MITSLRDCDRIARTALRDGRGIAIGRLGDIGGFPTNCSVQGGDENSLAQANRELQVGF